MEKEFHFNYDKESKILYKFHNGLVSSKNVISSWKFALEMNLIPNDIKGIIIDYKNADLNSIGDKEIVQIYQDFIEIFRGMRIAILTSNIDEFIVPILVRYENDEYESAPFINDKDAVKWVLEGYKKVKQPHN